MKAKSILFKDVSYSKIFGEPLKWTDYEPEGGLRRDASNPFEPFTDRTATSGAEVYVFVSPKSSLRLVPPEPSSPSIT